MKRLLPIFLVLLLAGAAYAGWVAVTGTSADSDTTFVALPPAAANDGFAQALVPNDIVFPRDLGPHNDYQTEWWYYTGNLQTESGRDFGYQLTFFRRALTPEVAAGDSSWRSNQIYLAHFTVSDIADGGFYPAERFSRGSAGLAGAHRSRLLAPRRR